MVATAGLLCAQVGPWNDDWMCSRARTRRRSSFYFRPVVVCLSLYVWVPKEGFRFFRCLLSRMVVAREHKHRCCFLCSRFQGWGIPSPLIGRTLYSCDFRPKARKRGHDIAHPPCPRVENSCKPGRCGRREAPVTLLHTTVPGRSPPPLSLSIP